jgi:hypothetical protein
MPKSVSGEVFIDGSKAPIGLNIHLINLETNTQYDTVTFGPYGNTYALPIEGENGDQILVKVISDSVIGEAQGTLEEKPIKINVQARRNSPIAGTEGTLDTGKTGSTGSNKNRGSVPQKNSGKKEPEVAQKKYVNSEDNQESITGNAIAHDISEGDEGLITAQEVNRSLSAKNQGFFSRMFDSIFGFFKRVNQLVFGGIA